MERLLAAELTWAIRHFEFELLLDDDFLSLQRPLNRHDSFKLDKILDDVESYLSELNLSLQQINRDGTEWYTTGRGLVIKVLDVIKNIDDFLSKVLLLPLVLGDGVITAKLKRVSQILLDCKLALLTIKKKIDIVAHYKEIRGLIIDGLNEEVRECNDMFTLSKITGLPHELPKNITLEQITAKMKLGEMSQSNTFAVRTVALPMFSESEQNSNTRFEMIERRLDPIQVAMDFLEQRVQGFNSMCGTVFPGAIIELNRDYDQLRKLWEQLLTEFVTLKKQSVDARWHSLFLFLVEDILKKSLAMIAEVKKDHLEGSFLISDELGSTFKTCSNAITLIHKAFMENVIYDKELTRKYNDTLLPRWGELNVLLSNDFHPSKTASPLTNDFSGYKPIRMAHSRVSLSEHRKEKLGAFSSTGLGLDLGLDVNPSPTIPVSVKTDRIVDLSIDADILPKNSIQAALMNILETQVANEDDDTDTLVHATSRNSLELEKPTFWRLLRETPKRKSKIPVMNSNYIRLGYPVIKKMYVKGYTHTKIPSISPLNPVFISPDRRSQPLDSPVNDTLRDSKIKRFSTHVSSPESDCTGLRSPPVFHLPRRESTAGKSSSEGSVCGEDVFKGNRSRRSSSLKLKAEKMSLVGTMTPNLAFEVGQLGEISPDRISLRSSSPERPESSIGSRFDDLHLTQPLKQMKKLWR